MSFAATSECYCSIWRGFVYFWSVTKVSYSSGTKERFVGGILKSATLARHERERESCWNSDTGANKTIKEFRNFINSWLVASSAPSCHACFFFTKFEMIVANVAPAREGKGIWIISFLRRYFFKLRKVFLKFAFAKFIQFWVYWKPIFGYSYLNLITVLFYLLLQKAICSERQWHVLRPD